MSKGDKYTIVEPEKMGVQEYYPVGSDMIVVTDNDDGYLHDKYGCCYTEAWLKAGYLILIEEGRMKLEYKIGETVTIHNHVECAGGVACGWAVDGEMEQWLGKGGTIIDCRSDGTYTVKFSGGDDWTYLPHCFVDFTKVVKKDNFDDLIEKKGRYHITAGSTEVYKATRRKKGQDQFVIRYEGTTTSNGCLYRQDLLPMAAALLKLHNTRQRI